MSQDGFVSTVLAQAGIAAKGIYVTRCRIIRGRRDDFGTAPPEPVASFVTQFRDWCFSSELAQMAYQIPVLPLPARTGS